MNASETVSSLNFMTIGIVLVLAIVALLWFLRKPGNRHADREDRADRDREILDEREEERRP